MVLQEVCTCSEHDRREGVYTADGEMREGRHNALQRKPVGKQIMQHPVVSNDARIGAVVKRQRISGVPWRYQENGVYVRVPIRKRIYIYVVGENKRQPKVPSPQPMVSHIWQKTRIENGVHDIPSTRSPGRRYGVAKRHDGRPGSGTVRDGGRKCRYGT